MEPKKQINKRKLLLISIMILGIFTAVYLSFSVYFSNHFYWGTSIAGKDCSCMTVQDAGAMLTQSMKDYNLTINAREGVTETVSAQDLSVDYQIRDELMAIREQQNPFLWFRGIFQKSEYTVSKQVDYDEEGLKELVEALSIFSDENEREPVNAYISDYMPDLKGYMVIEEDEGTCLMPEAEEMIVDAFLQKQEYLDLEGKGLYRMPNIRSENSRLNRLVECLNRYTQTSITYEFGKERVVLDGDTIHNWISVRGGYVYLDQTAVREYVRELAKEHNTYYNEKEFVTTSGVKKKLSSTYGWLLDIEGETTALIEDLQSGKSISREPVYSRRGANFEGNNIGDSYVEIDLGNQHLYLYIEGELILETDLVSGCISNGNGTPEGIYDLDYKTRNVVLRGPTWESYVNYWMPFNGSVGMHDAAWRNYFGGEIYINGGSHGCINLPYQAAKELYEYLYSGMPVICYY